MNIIRESNQKILNELGPNIKIYNQNYRLLKYLVIEDIDNGKAIHNELTRSFVWIPNIQWNNIFYNLNVDYCKWLWDNYFLVNEGFNEYEIQKSLKNKFRPSYKNENYLKPGTIYEFTIFPTMVCNAQCNYCYEKGRPQKPMTLETAKKVGNWIINNAAKNKKLQLRWFGGEPLIGEKCIDTICQIVKDAGLNYKSSITTNGFLFKNENLNKYNDLWHLKSCQITLDGTEEAYNKIKNYKNIKGKSPYQIVIGNIKMLSENNIFVSIRLNTDVNNADNIKELIKELYKKFKDNNYVKPYCYSIFEDENNPRTDEENKILYEKIDEVESTLLKYGFGHTRDRSTEIRFTHCMIDHGGAVVISTQGDIGLCEHYSEDHFWGHIDKPEMKDMDEIKKFQSYEEDLSICKSCKILPSCIRAKMCINLRKCNIYIKDYNIKKAHRSVKDMYMKWFKEVQDKNNNQQTNNEDYRQMEYNQNITNKEKTLKNNKVIKFIKKLLK